MPTKFFDGGLPVNTEVGFGIDQSLTGFAMSAVSEKGHLTWVYKSPYTGVERLSDIRECLKDHLEYLAEKGNLIKDVAMEGTVVASHAASALGELSAVVKLTLLDHYDGDPQGYPLQVPPMTLKKYTTGKGNSKKQEMLLHTYKTWGTEFNDDNAADAYSLGRLALGSHSNAVQKAVVEQMKDLKYRDQPRF